jgi:hypothetical protein
MFKAFDEEFDNTFFPFLTFSYNILLGNWTKPTSPDFFSLILFLATVLNPVISLNLLIAILTDTYKTVNINKVIADSQELASMILEVETLLFWKRKENHKMFIQIADHDSVEDLNDLEYDTAIEKMKRKIVQVRTDIYINDKIMNKFTEDVKSLTMKIRQKMSVLC